MSFNRDAYLMHYNHNHDRLGRFARSVGSAGGKVGSSVMSSSKKKKKGQPPEADIKKGKAANTKLSDKDRKRIVDSGDAKEVAKYKDRLSTRELETAVNRLQKEKVQRIDLEKKLSDLNSDGRDKQRATAIDKIEKYGNDLERISNGLEKAAKMYNTAAKIHNLMSSGNDQWPIYGEKKSKDKSAKEKELIERGEKLKERNLKTKENKSKREEREEAFASRKLDDAEADYDREREKKTRQERLSKIQIQTYNPDNEEGTYYSDKIYDYSADGEGKYYTERDYEKKKKLRHDDLVEAGENFLAHYNHNHDKLGRFARASNAVGNFRDDLTIKQANRTITKSTKNKEKLLEKAKNAKTKDQKAYYKGYANVEQYLIDKSQLEIAGARENKKQRLLKSHPNDTITYVDMTTGKVETHYPEGMKVSNHNIDNVSELTYRRATYGDYFEGTVKTPKNEKCYLTLEINDSKFNSDGSKFMIEKNEHDHINKIINNVNKNDAATRKYISDRMYEYVPEWSEGKPISKKQFTNDLYPESIHINKSGNYYADYIDKNDTFGGHVHTVEYDQKTGKPKYLSLNG